MGFINWLKRILKTKKVTIIEAVPFGDCELCGNPAVDAYPEFVWYGWTEKGAKLIRSTGKYSRRCSEHLRRRPPEDIVALEPAHMPLVNGVDVRPYYQ